MDALTGARGACSVVTRGRAWLGLPARSHPRRSNREFHAESRSTRREVICALEMARFVVTWLRAIRPIKSHRRSQIRFQTIIDPVTTKRAPPVKNKLVFSAPSAPPREKFRFPNSAIQLPIVLEMTAGWKPEPRRPPIPPRPRPFAFNPPFPHPSLGHDEACSS